MTPSTAGERHLLFHFVTFEPPCEFRGRGFDANCPIPGPANLAIERGCPHPPRAILYGGLQVPRCCRTRTGRVGQLNNLSVSGLLGFGILY